MKGRKPEEEIDDEETEVTLQNHHPYRDTILAGNWRNRYPLKNRYSLTWTPTDCGCKIFKFVIWRHLTEKNATEHVLEARRSHAVLILRAPPRFSISDWLFQPPDHNHPIPILPHGTAEPENWRPIENTPRSLCSAYDCL